MTTTISARIAGGVVGFAFLATAFPALAHNDNGSNGWKFWNKYWGQASTTATTTATSTTATYNVTCVQTAVGAHEDAGITAINVYNTALTSALTTRKTEMIAAWGNLDFATRISALMAAQSKYRAAVKAAQTTLKASRTSANTTFKTAMAACGVTTADVAGRNSFEKKKHKEMKMGGWNWLGFNLSL